MSKDAARRSGDSVKTQLAMAAENEVAIRRNRSQSTSRRRSGKSKDPYCSQAEEARKRLTHRLLGFLRCRQYKYAPKV